MKIPSLDEWLKEAKKDAAANECGMYLFHNGVVRETPKAKVRELQDAASLANAEKTVDHLEFSYDSEKVETAKKMALEMPGIFYVRVWLNEGRLEIGDDIMLVLIGGDIRPHVVDALQALVGEIKNNCVVEQESYTEE